MTPGSSGDWAPVGAEADGAGGYLVAWNQAGQDAYQAWQVDGGGVFLSLLLDTTKGSQYALQALEARMLQDLNGDGTIGLVMTTVEAVGATRLVQEADAFFLLDAGGNGPMLKRPDGNPVVAGGPAGWHPVGAEAHAGGYLVAWQLGAQDQYVAWQTDANGQFTASVFGGVVSGGQYVLQALETTLGQDLNGDGTVGPLTSVVEAVGATRLVQEADAFFLLDAGGAGPILKRPDANGQFSANLTGGVVSGGQYVLQALEATLGQDLNGDGVVGLKLQQVENKGSVFLTIAADEYALYDGTGHGPLLTRPDGSNPVVGQTGGWSPIGAEGDGSGGYLVAWKNDSQDQYLVWDTDATGKFVSSLVGVVTSSQYALQALETRFHQDLNGDGTVGPLTSVVEAMGATRLVQEGDAFFLLNAGGTGPILKRPDGNQVVAGGVLGWHPVGAEANAGGYVVAWQLGAQDQYVAWQTDANGQFSANLTGGVVSGGQYVLQALEATLGQDLNGDGVVGPVTAVLEAHGAGKLVQKADEYFLGPVARAATVVLTRPDGSAVVAGASGGWSPVAAEPGGGGWQVVWQQDGAANFVAWQTDAAGKFSSGLLGVTNGGQYVLQALETQFSQDLNGDGTVGPVTTRLENAGTTFLTREADQYFLLTAGGSGPALKRGDGSPVLVGLSGGWSPVGAETVSGGYEVAWKQDGANNFVAWLTDASGQFSFSLFGVAAGTQYPVQAAELVLGQDLNGDGVVGPKQTRLENSGSTFLTQIADGYYFLDAAGHGPQMRRPDGTLAVAGALGGWTPVGVELVGGSYLLAQQQDGTGNFRFWTEDASGSYLNDGLGVLAGGDYRMQAQELSLAQDVNGDGGIGITITAFSDSSTQLLGYLQPLSLDSHLASITLTDTSVLGIAYSVFNPYQATLDKLVSGQSLTVGAVPVANHAQVQADSHVGGFVVNDTAAHVLGGLAALNGDSHLSSVVVSDSASLGLTYAQYAANGSVVGKLGTGVATVSAVGAANSTAVNANGHVGHLAVTDTLANIGTYLDALEAEAKGGKLTDIHVSDSAQTLSITKAQSVADADALALLSGSYTVKVQGLVINLNYDSTAASMPAAMKTALAYAASYFDSLISTQETVNLTVGYGYVAGQYLGSNTLGASLDDAGVFVSFSQFKTAFAAHASSADQQTALANMTSDPFSGGHIYVPNAEAKALGLTANVSSYDASIGFGIDGVNFSFAYDPANRAVAGKFDFIGVALHEISHALGRIALPWDGTSYGNSYFAALDLYRYSAPGVNALHNPPQGYFSIDGGKTNLDWFATSSDTGDWYYTAGNDANDAYSNPGAVNAFTAVDVKEMNVLGYAL